MKPPPLQVVFAPELDPRTRAIYSARCVIEWVRRAGERRAAAEDADDDMVLEYEGQQVDDEARMYDMGAVEALAAGDDGWAFGDGGDEDEEEEDEDEDGGSVAPLSVPALRQQVE